LPIGISQNVSQLTLAAESIVWQIAVTICTQEETGVSVITLEDQAAQLKDCGTATTP